MTSVFNLATGESRFYTCSPEEAVIAAFAQERGDWETWNYRRRYAYHVRKSQHGVSCGNWVASVEQ